MRTNYRIKATQCPVCSAKLDMLSTLGVKAPPPQPGDITLCLQCSHLMAFDEDGGRRELTTAEREEALASPSIQRVLAARAATRRVH
jgi:hypothetical protein